MSEQDGDSGLIMPFVPVRSAGGPYDDDAYAAGWEMGLLDAQLEREALTTAAASAEMTIRTTNRGQADLIAMRYGFAASFTESEEMPEWTWAEFKQ